MNLIISCSDPEKEICRQQLLEITFGIYHLTEEQIDILDADWDHIWFLSEEEIKGHLTPLGFDSIICNAVFEVIEFLKRNQEK